MKITPKITGGQPIGARIDVYVEDVPYLAKILAYAHGVVEDDDRTEKMLQRLAGVCEAINSDVRLRRAGPEYHKTRAAFDPTYPRA